jgi:nucleotide-binding universal stress UspA family protein
MFPFKKLLVPLDGSEYAEKALEPALAIARAMNAQVVLFRVAQPVPRTAKLAEMPDVYNDVVAATFREAEDYLREMRARFPDDDIAIEFRPASEGVARQIVDFATESGVNLIVMTSHGRTGVRRWVYGSVAEKVLHGFPCSTLIVRCWQDT